MLTAAGALSLASPGGCLTAATYLAVFQLGDQLTGLGVPVFEPAEKGLFELGAEVAAHGAGGLSLAWQGAV